MTVQELRDKLFDPDFDISVSGWHIIEVVRDLRLQMKGDLIDEITQQMLLRLIQDSPHVYAITIGQFPEFEGIHNFWKRTGSTIPTGLYGLYLNRMGLILKRSFLTRLRNNQQRAGGV